MTTALAPDMARTKAKPNDKPEPDDRERKPMAIQIRGTLEWKAWAERMAKHDGRALAGLVDRALQLYGKQIGFDEPAPER